MTRNGGSSLVGQASVSADTRFDVREESGALALLHAIHRTTLAQDIKNNLRDALFSYRQSSGGDMQPLTQLFSQYGFTLVSDAPSNQQTQVAESAPPAPAFGQRRQAPQFGASQVPPQKEESAPAHIPPPQEEPKVQPKAEAEPIPEMPKIEEPVSPVEEAPSKSDTQATYANPSERIALIKREVNAKVGNPVSLIAANNEIGKEYMTALLDAMKAANGGTAGGVNASMERLEKAFAQVQGLDISAVSKPKQEYAEPEVKTPPPPTPEPPKEEEPAPAHIPVPSQEEPKVQPLAEMETVPENLPTPIQEEVSSVKEQPETQTTKETESAPAQGITSVAKEKQLQELMRTNRTQAVANKKQEEEKELASMDPLMVPRVTAGLQQLLSEWSLFKSSGFLGTGPSGTDHPLYKKLQGLSMAAVIAGRFEGSTPAIKQSITDYMNGWRYEEGVIHEHMETFEHYLRRVVRHILDKQGK